MLPLHALDSERDFDVPIKQIGDARIVLLSETSRGTSEDYDWRRSFPKVSSGRRGLT